MKIYLSEEFMDFLLNYCTFCEVVNKTYIVKIIKKLDFDSFENIYLYQIPEQKF